jgi:OmpA-OmpF porin, OOP family
MRSHPLINQALISACLSASMVSSQAADGRFYDPSNQASQTGNTVGYRLYRTIGCPGRELLGVPCPIPMPDARISAPPAPAMPPKAAVAPIITPPAPTRVVVPTPARTAQYCTIVDIQFEINQDEIQREYRERLAVLADFMKKYPDTTALIEGHTDDVGSDADNQALSERRATSVVDYLVQHFGIAPGRLKAIGHGETRPVAANDSEAGKRLNRRINAVIACVTDIEGLAMNTPRVTMALQMEFDRNQAEIKPEYADDLAKVAKFMNEHPDVTASVEGHTGSLHGSPEMILDISRQRARNVVNELVYKHGIARSRLDAEGFGMERRYAYNTSLEGRQENRRVNIIFNYPR